MAEESRSEYAYAALCIGDDRTGTWLWCSTGRKKVSLSNSLVLTIINGAYQVRYDHVARIAKVLETGQVIPNVRLAGIGYVPSDIPSLNYNTIINDFLRTGAYRSVDYFVHDGD